MDRTTTSVTVEYTAYGKRVSKCFANAYQARSFYAAKMRAGAAPKVTAAGDSIMAKNNATTTTTEATATATAVKPKTPAKQTKAPTAKNTPAKDKAAKPASNGRMRVDNRTEGAGGIKISGGKKVTALLLYLLKAKATTEAKSVPRSTIHATVAGSAVTDWLKKSGVIEVVANEDKSRNIYLTPLGIKEAERRYKGA